MNTHFVISLNFETGEAKRTNDLRDLVAILERLTNSQVVSDPALLITVDAALAPTVEKLLDAAGVETMVALRMPEYEPVTTSKLLSEVAAFDRWDPEDYGLAQQWVHREPAHPPVKSNGDEPAAEVEPGEQAAEK